MEYIDDKTDNAERDLIYVTRLTSFLLLCVMQLCWRYFVPGHRTFEMSPVWGVLGALPDAVNWGVYFVFIGLNLWLLFAPLSRVAAKAVLLCALFWCLQDLGRMMQAYLLMYFFAIFVVAFAPRGKDAYLAVCALRIMICGVYFWAGFHKINATFYFRIFPWFIEVLHKVPPAGIAVGWLDYIILPLILITPFFEAAIGILLWFPKWRRLATCMAFMMLSTILICLGPVGHNWEPIVWTWNVYLFLIEWRLFFADSQESGMGKIGALGKHRNFAKKHWLAVLSVAVFIFAPMAAMFTEFYPYMGFKLYSGNTVTADIHLPSNETLAKAPAYVRKQVDAQHVLSTIMWNEAELYTAAAPTEYVLKLGAKGLCTYLDYPTKALLRINHPAPFYAVKTTFKDMPLCP